MKFAYFNQDGRIELSVNDDTLTNVPANAIELSDDLWDNRFDLLLVNNEITISKVNLPIPTISELIFKKRQHINADFEKSIQQITAGYPASETSSWGKQEAEARAYVADAAATTPLIDALSSVRGVAKDELVSRIIAKADLFATVSGQLIGKRQALEDALDALPETATAEDVAAIVW